MDGEPLTGRGGPWAAVAAGGVLTAVGAASLAPVLPAVRLVPALVIAVTSATVLGAYGRAGGLLAWPVIAVATALSVGAPGGNLAADALEAPRTLVTASLPLAVTSGLVLWLFSVVWWAAYWTARANAGSGGRALALLPSLLLLTGGTAVSVSVPADRAVIAAVFVAVAGAMLTLRARPSGSLLRLFGGLLTCLVAVPLAAWLPARAHPVDVRNVVRPPHHTDPLLSPLAEADVWASAPPVPLFRVRSSVNVPFRLTVLDTYDGTDWSSGATYTTSGPYLPQPPPAPGSRLVTADVELLALSTPWLPAPDRPVRLTGVPALVDRRDGTLAVPPGRPSSGLHYQIVSRVSELSERAALAAGPAQGAAYTPFTVVPQGIPAGMLHDAERLTAQASSPYEQLVLLQRALHDGYRYLPRATPGRTAGHLAFFYQQSKLGTADQFSATFAVLARHLGFPTRLAIGFGPGRPVAGGWSQVLSTDVTIWPEVALSGLGWVPFYPLPAIGSGTNGGEPASRAALDQKIAPVRHPVPPAHAPAVRHRAAHGRALWPYGLVLVCLLAIGYPISTALARMLVRRRARSGEPATQIAAAWHLTRHELARLGHPSLAALTPDETVAYVGDRLGPSAGAAMERLASALSDSVYSPRRPGPTEADAAWFATRRLRTDVGTAIGPRGRARRSLELPHSPLVRRDPTDGGADGDKGDERRQL